MALLRDEAWHALDDLRAVTHFPSEWVEELRAEGILDVRRNERTVLVRLRATT